MRKLLLAGFILASAQLLSQSSMPMNSDTERVTYEEVFDATGSADALFLLARDWFNDFFPNSRSVITNTDPVKDKITGTGKFQLNLEDDKGSTFNIGQIRYSIKVWTKDEKVRYKITDVRLYHSVYYGIEKWMDPAHDDAERNPQKLEKIKEYIEDLISNFKTFMTEDKTVVNEDDW